MKRIISFFFAVAMIFSVSCVSVFADDSTLVSCETVYFEDGSYMVKTVREDISVQPNSIQAVKTKSGSATVDTYNASGDRVVSVTVRGSFRYDGSSAEAITASCSYNIIQSGWSCVSSDAYCDGPTAFANAVFEKFLLRDLDVTATLTCSPDGVLS